MFISKRAKVVSEKPAYEKKDKSESGGDIYRYDSKHIALRWKEKQKKLKLLEKNIEALRKQYEKDLSAESLRVRAEACIVCLIDETAVRIGNEESAKNEKTYGATTLKVKHLTLSGNNAKFKFVGKDHVKQNIEMSNAKAAKILKELIKGKKDEDFIFEIDGKKVWDRAVNRYLKDFNISAKDLRGFFANKLMKDVLKKKDWKEALEEVADIVGHEPATLKNQYLMPDLVEKYEKKKLAALSVRAKLTDSDRTWLRSIAPAVRYTDTGRTTTTSTVKTNPLIDKVWGQIRKYLPTGSKLTSGVRTADDQKRILESYWAKAGLSRSDAAFGDYDAMSKILKRHNYIVAPVEYSGQYGHLKGNAFDISGADLYQIYNMINNISGVGGMKLKPLIEEANNCVHVTILADGENQSADDRQIDNSFILEMIDAANEANSKINKKAEENPHGVGTTMGFGKEDEPGDWFEKSQIFLDRTEVPDYELHDISEIEAKTLVEKEPDKFFYRGLHKQFPSLEADALKNLIEKNAKFFFIFKYHKRDEEPFKGMVEKAAELLSQQDVRAFFYYNLHHTFPELGRGAIIQLVDTNPDSFFDFGLQKDYPDFEESANAARNIKDPNKVELEQPEWIKNDPGPITIREKSAGAVEVDKTRFDDNIVKNIGIPQEAIAILSTLPGKPIITETYVSGEIVVSVNPRITIEWFLVDNIEATKLSDKYTAKIMTVERPSPNYSERTTIFNCSDFDAVNIAKELKKELSDPNVLKEISTKVVDTIVEKETQKSLRKSLNSKDVLISKTASDVDMFDEEEKRIFDLLKDVIKHYKLNVDVRLVGGSVRDALLKKFKQ